MPSPSPPPTSVHHIHPLPLSKISSALVYYCTCPNRHSTLLCYQPPHRYYHVDNSNAAPSNYVRIIATHYYRCRWLITNISMIISTTTTHRCCVIQYQYAIITSLPCQNDFIYNCLENSHHYLTFFLSTAYTYSNHHNNPPKNITLYVIYISQSKEETYTTYFERWENL